jgi:hypothetical protein
MLRRDIVKRGGRRGRKGGEIRRLGLKMKR